MTTHTLLDRFLRYVRIDTKADEKSTTYPSSPGQLVLGAMLRDELLALGLKDAVQNEHGLVFATVPGNVPGAPTIAFNSHVDTNPENSGKDVNPQVIRGYKGGDITLPERPVEGDSRCREPGTERTDRQDDHHHRRHHAPGRRRQGRAVGHHGSCPCPGRTPRDPARAGADRLHLRRGNRLWGEAPGTQSNRRGGRLHPGRDGVAARSRTKPSRRTLQP